MLKNRVYSVITIAGLAVGLTAFFLVRLYVDYERSYDQFHARKDRIFRLEQDRYNKGEVTNQSVMICSAVGRAVAEHFAAVETYVNILYSPAVLTYEGNALEEPHFYFASEDFFEVFTVPLLQGVDSLALRRPGTAMLSRSAAQKYFGNDDPIGKVLDLRGLFNLEVTGIFEDFPSSSHMEIDVLASLQTYIDYAGERAIDSWKWDGYYTYILLQPGARAEEIENGLPSLVEERTGGWLKESGQDMIFHLQPLTSIHLFSNFKNEMKPNGDHQMVYYLGLIAYFILSIAYINYINVATVKSLERAKEVGIRKVLGGFRFQLVAQFLSESLIYNVTALLLSFGAVYLLIPSFGELCGRDFSTGLLLSERFLVLALCILLGGTILSGSYPSMVLSGFKPMQVLKGKFTGTSNGATLRKGLVVTQFVTAITLIICTYVVYQQIRFLQTQSLGFNLDQVLVVRAPLKKDSLYNEHLKTFNTKVEQLASVESMTSMREPPGARIIEYANGIKRLGSDDDQVNQFQIVSVDEDFTKVFNLELTAGRMYRDTDPDDYSVMVINEQASAVLGFGSPREAINEKIVWFEDTITIIGVMQDYHHETLKYAVSPIFFPLDPGYGAYIPIRLKGGSFAETIASIEDLYVNHFPGNPFSAYFLDDHYDRQYHSDIRFGKVVGVFSVLAIVITCLGLFGLSSYTVLLRTKEIGIRKVLGATSTSIVQLLCKEYTVLIAIAMVVAIPLARYAMSGWLENFENKINLTWWIFLLPNILVLALAWLTIGAHTLRAAATNPVDTLRHE
ncbi:MAG TPA: ABC transporter permease [Cyclobacteriaceae bacterium]